MELSELIQKLRKLNALKNRSASISNESGGGNTNEQEYQVILEEIERDYPGMKVMYMDLPHRAIHVLAPID